MKNIFTMSYLRNPKMQTTHINTKPYEPRLQHMTHSVQNTSLSARENHIPLYTLPSFFEPYLFHFFMILIDSFYNKTV